MASPPLTSALVALSNTSSCLAADDAVNVEQLDLAADHPRRVGNVSFLRTKSFFLSLVARTMLKTKRLRRPLTTLS